jgi:hypothetical protein
MSKNIHDAVKKLSEDLQKSIKTTNIALKQVTFYKSQLLILQKEIDKYKDSVDTALGTIHEQNKYIEYLLKRIDERNKTIQNISERKLN